MLSWLFDKLEFLLPGRSQQELSDWLGVSIDELKSIDLEYRSFYIPKRSGGRRLIHAPNPALKSIQRKILRRLLRGLRTHPCAVGFEPGKSIVSGACQHTGQSVVCRFDLVDFFPTIRAKRIYRYFRAIGWNDPSSRLLVALTTRNGVLPQGAPTSPRLSNLVNWRMDARLEALAINYWGAYTRYADDITISTSKSDADVHDLVKCTLRIIRSCGYEPHIGKKFDVRRSHQRQSVTGLVVNDGVQLPRERRRWLRAVKHRAKAHWNYQDPADADSSKPVLCKAPTISEQQFHGWLALESMIDRQREAAAVNEDDSTC